MKLSEAKQFVKDDPDAASKIVYAAHRFLQAVDFSGFEKALRFNDALGRRGVKAINTLIDAMRGVVSESGEMS